MKKIVAVFLTCVLLLINITSVYGDESYDSNSITEEDISAMEFSGLKDPNLLQYVENTVYSDLVNELDSSEYFVENVSAVYISKEFIEELDYNSQENIFFGYTISEIEDLFKGQKYVFTLGEDNTTTVVPFEDYDDTYEKIIKNVAIGSGVILLCVTVTVLTGGTAPTAISVIFAASAKNATVFALSSGIFSFVSSAVLTGLETHDLNEALKAGALKGSEGFKWGAISGGISGGASEAIALYGATRNGLTMNEAAIIQKESSYPLDVIKQFKSMDEYQIYKAAGLKCKIINGKTALVRDIDLNYLSDLGGKQVTNLERMAQGYAPIDPATGKVYQLHHINQDMNGTLAILTESEHQGNSAILNIFGKESAIDRPAFGPIRKQFWKSYASMFIM